MAGGMPGVERWPLSQRAAWGRYPNGRRHACVAPVRPLGRTSTRSPRSGEPPDFCVFRASRRLRSRPRRGTAPDRPLPGCQWRQPWSRQASGRRRAIRSCGIHLCFGVRRTTFDPAPLVMVLRQVEPAAATAEAQQVPGCFRWRCPNRAWWANRQPGRVRAPAGRYRRRRWPREQPEASQSPRETGWTSDRQPAVGHTVRSARSCARCAWVSPA